MVQVPVQVPQPVVIQPICAVGDLPSSQTQLGYNPDLPDRTKPVTAFLAQADSLDIYHAPVALYQELPPQVN
jgi:hypothetical protein